MAFRTRALRELGGFDTALGAGTPTCSGEDLAVFAQLIWRGQSIGFEPAALVHHRHRREEDALRRQIEGYGTGWGAMLLALALDDPRHLGGMLATVPRGAHALGGTYLNKLRSAQPQIVAHTQHAASVARSRTRELARLEIRGIALSPARYVRSRRMWPR